MRPTQNIHMGPGRKSHSSTDRSPSRAGAMQPLDVSVRGSTAITDSPLCSRPHWRDIYILLRPPLIKSNGFMHPFSAGCSVVAGDKGNHKMKKKFVCRVEGKGVYHKIKLLNLNKSVRREITPKRQ